MAVNKLFVDSGLGRVGINTITPTALLDVFNGDVNFSNGTTQQFFLQSATGRVGIGTASPTQTLNIIGDLNVTGTSYLSDFVIEAGDLIIGTTNISSTYVGIGTTAPNTTLQVMGDS